MRKSPRRNTPPPTKDTPLYEPCGSCIGGWKTIWNQRPGLVPLPTVERCACYHTWQQKIAAGAPETKA